LCLFDSFLIHSMLMPCSVQLYSRFFSEIQKETQNSAICDVHYQCTYHVVEVLPERRELCNKTSWKRLLGFPSFTLKKLNNTISIINRISVCHKT